MLQDEDLIAQAQERERARLEEEAAILAAQQAQAQTQPPPVWAGSSGEAIDQFNAQPGIVSAPTTIDSPQYQQELARAQAGSGFIAPDVGPGANVITPGYDPATDPRAIIARKEAANLQRNQYVASLVNGGATYAEALRAALGRYPSVGDPNTMLRAEALALKQNFQPKVVSLGGMPWVESSRGSFKPVPPQKFVPGRPTPAIRARDDILKSQISDLRAQLKPGSTGLLMIGPEKAAELEAQISRKEQERVALFETPESNPNVDQVGWQNMRERFNAPPRPAAPSAPAPTTKELTADIAREILKSAGGDKAKARKMALDAGYKF